MGKILLVEDDKLLRRVFAKALAPMTAQVLEASDGYQARLFLEEHLDIDVILSDWMMPGMTGLELLEHVRGVERTRRLPFVMLTARNESKDVVRILNAGADDYITKPCQIDEVVARCRNLLRLKKYQDELLRLAITDGLTGLYNHAHFVQQLEKEVERVERFGGGLSLLLLDVDHFKRFNDTFGHPAGDAVLKELGRILRQSVRKLDLAARYGGEEFAVILPGRNGDEATTPAERILHNVRDFPFPVQGEAQHITISIGLAVLQEKEGANALIQRADQALYAAKSAGRNRIESAG